MRPQELYLLFSSVSRLKGVGVSTAEALSRLIRGDGSIPTVRDVLFHLPVALLDRRFTCDLSHAPDNTLATFVVRVDEHLPPPPGIRRGGKRPYKIFCSNESGTLTLVFFNVKGDYLKHSLPVGSKRVVSGRIEHFDGMAQMTHPDVIAPVEELAAVQTVEPVYPLTHAMTSRRISKLVEQVLAKLEPLAEWLPSSLLRSGDLPPWREAIAAVHKPLQMSDLLPVHPARVRLAMDEILANQLRLALARLRARQKPGRVFSGGGALREAVLRALPFRLTANQQSVLAEIDADMASGQRMARLLQGDVGSGKTIVGFLTMLSALEHGTQAALMAPTEIIARQHFATLSGWCAAIGVQPVLLTGSVKGATRKRALEQIAGGEAKVVVGTHALFQEHVQFSSLAVVVVDEQHRFGVQQRLALVSKGEHPHILHMTATPIPRSMQMTLYGDMDCSILHEKPPGRKPVTTRMISIMRYRELLDAVKRALASGQKIYWVCPMIEELERGETMQLFTVEEDVAAAEARYHEFKAIFGESVGLVHGRMSAEQRTRAVDEFASGASSLLVATTVVEVGVDVRDATIMIIERAERFGLSQLHQLRGRVGRGEAASSCVLLHGEPLSEQGRQRLSIVRDTEDGFKIAEEDMRLRGAGELLGTRQSGLPDFRFTDLQAHSQALVQLREYAAKVMQQDPQLTLPEHAPLKTLLYLFDFESVLAEQVITEK